jgi:hypothetical protein
MYKTRSQICARIAVEQDERDFVPVLHALLITLPAVATGRPCRLSGTDMSHEGERGTRTPDHPDQKTQQPGG